MCEVGGTYIVAVSGGVDSVVLLDMLLNGRWQMVDGKWNKAKTNHQLPTTNYQFVVAHVDHGMREESGEDAAFVESLAKKYGLPFEIHRAHLGSGASEEEARRVRYNFLRQCSKKHKALGIITAHHQDDLIETAVINLLRGTGWRGVAPMGQTLELRSQILEQHPQSCHPELDSGSSKDMDSRLCGNDELVVLRPLLGTTKKELINYAKAHNLEWCEDSTNINQDYLRNYVRHTLLPRANKVNPGFSEKLLAIIKNTHQLKDEIEIELNLVLQNAKCKMQNSSSTTYHLPRYQLIMWPAVVAQEGIYYVLTTLDPNWHPSKMQIERALLFCKTAQPHKTLEISKQLKLSSTLRTMTFQFNP